MARTDLSPPIIDLDPSRISISLSSLIILNNGYTFYSGLYSSCSCFWCQEHDPGLASFEDETTCILQRWFSVYHDKEGSSPYTWSKGKYSCQRCEGCL